MQIIREQYSHDYTTKYYSNITYQAFYRDMNKYNHLEYIVFRNSDIIEHQKLQDKRDIGFTLSLFTSMLAIYKYNSLPFFKKFQGKWTKFVMKLFIFGTPFSMVYIATAELKEKQLWDQYIKNFGRYILYKQTGNIQDLDSSIVVE